MGSSMFLLGDVDSGWRGIEMELSEKAQTGLWRQVHGEECVGIGDRL
jgi:hypothetical protein